MALGHTVDKKYGTNAKYKYKIKRTLHPGWPRQVEPNVSALEAKSTVGQTYTRPAGRYGRMTGTGLGSRYATESKRTNSSSYVIQRTPVHEAKQNVQLSADQGKASKAAAYVNRQETKHRKRTRLSIA